MFISQELTSGQDANSSMAPDLFNQLLTFVEFSVKMPKFGKMDTKPVIAKGSQVCTINTEINYIFLFSNKLVFLLQYRPASLSIDPAFRASACTDCEYIECTIAIIIIVILVRSLFLVDVLCSFG